LDGFDCRRIKIMKKFLKEIFINNLPLKLLAIVLGAFVVVVINIV